MNFNEFKLKTARIANEQFIARSLNPLDIGIERAAFLEDQLMRLILVAKQCECSTARGKVATWTRRLEKAKQVHDRFQVLKDTPAEFTPPNPLKRHPAFRAELASAIAGANA